MALWAILLTTYISLGAVQHDVLPSPYSGLLLAVLLIATIVAAVGVLLDRQSVADRKWLAAYLVEFETRTEVAADLRYARLHALAVGLERHLHDLDGPTAAVPRQRVVASVGSSMQVPGLDPEVLDLTRRIRENQWRDGA